MTLRTNHAILRSILKLSGCFAVSVFFSALLPQAAQAQGCVIARGGGCHIAVGDDGFPTPSSWQTTIAHRWFQSDRHFVGREEQKHRKQQGTEVINDSHFLDVILTYQQSRRISVDLTVPYSWHDRTSLYEHLGNSSGQRFGTRSSGLGDLRLTARGWVLNPENPRRGNFAIGVGIKAPTGDYKATDVFIRPGGPELRYVDSSIQPGDGGWGVTLDAQGFFHIAGNFIGYANGFYLFNPRDRVPATGFSVPDAYLLRTGVTMVLPQVEGLSFALGARMEGVPGEDIFGGSEGRRRPGYVIAAEPGVSYSAGSFLFDLSVPIAVERNRTRTFGATNVGDAAFADYTVNTTMSYRF